MTGTVTSDRLPSGGLLVRCCLAAVAVGVMAACTGPADGTYELPSAQVGQYETAYIALVVAAPDGDDLERGAGEYLVIRSNWDHRTDMGGWVVEDADGNRLPLGVGRQLDPGAQLRAHASCGQDTEDAVFACRDAEVLDDQGDVLQLLDSGGNEVARFAYGTAGE